MSNIVQLTVENFQQVILEQSKSSLVLVDFWAEQVPESIELKNKLETVAAQRSNDFVLALVDCQADQQIAMQFGIQGLPTAIFIKDGQPVDGIAGPQTDEQLTEFLDKHLPKIEDNLLLQAKQLLSDGNLNDAYSAAMQAYQANQDRADIKLTFADLSVQLGKVDDAKQLISTVMMVDQDSYYDAVKAKIELAEEAANSPELQALEQAVEQSPSDLTLKHQLAAQYVQVNRHQDALELLYVLVRDNRGDTIGKDLLLDVIKSLPDGDPLATQYRRKLYTLMY